MGDLELGRVSWITQLDPIIITKILARGRQRQESQSRKEIGRCCAAGLRMEEGAASHGM